MQDKVSIEKKEYQARVSKIQSLMKDKGIDVALISEHPDVYYFSGTAALAIMLLSTSGNPLLFVKLGFDMARRNTWLPAENLRQFQGIEKLLAASSELAPGARVIGVEKDIISASLWDKLTRKLNEHRFEDVSPLILATRMIKSEAEIKLLRRACDISNIGFKRCVEVLREGISEVEIQCEIEKAQRIAGADEAMIIRLLRSSGGFGGIASGPDTAIMSGPVVAISGRGTSSAHPYGSSPRRVQKGDLVVVNKGTVFEGYNGDEARTLVLGKATDKQRKFFEIDREIQAAAFDAIKPGALVSDVYNAAKKVAVKYDCADYFMGYGQCGVEYIGHGVGLEVDELPLVSPYDRTVLKQGMTMAIEPKLVVPGWGGVDVEDTVMVTDSGHEVLTSTVRKLIEVF